jgi:HSP20 family protein
MNLQSYDPLSFIEQFHNDVNRLLGNRWSSQDNDSNMLTGAWSPAIDVREETDRYIVIADVPGIDPKDIEITMENGVLTIQGERNYETTDEDKDSGYRRVERAYGKFFRRLALPDVADAENISAEGKNGVLEISIQKSEQAKPRRIEVKA